MANFKFFLICTSFSAILLFTNVTCEDEFCNKNWTDCQNPWISKLPKRIREMKKKNIEDEVISYHLAEEITQTGSDIPWFFNIPLLPVLFATSPTLPEGTCKTQAQRYLQELQNGTLWAAKMYDSSTKYPAGILDGQTVHLGNFDECYNLNAQIPSHNIDKEFEEMSGSYCLVTIEYHKMNLPTEKNRHLSLVFDPNGPVWEEIQENGDFRRQKRNFLEMALCVPATCSAEDIQLALYAPLKKIGEEKKFLVKTRVIGNTCQTKVDEPEFSTAAKVYCYVILGFFLLMASSTWYDIASKTSEGQNGDTDDINSMTTDILLCFSAKRNLKSITEVTYSHPGLDSIHFFRFLFMCLAIFGHRMMQYYLHPVANAPYIESTYSWRSAMVLYNGPIIIEAFFAFGGLLMSYYLLTELDKRKKINFFGAILIRFLRLTPLYVLVMMFISFVLPHLGNGPYWNSKVILESNSCMENWWTNILYINNYVNVERFCMFQGWYLAVDYHLYIMALFAIYIFWKMPRKIGYPFLLSIILLGCAIPFYITYHFNAQPFWMGLPNTRDVRQEPYFVNHYIKTHERISSYFVGVLAGAIIYDHSLSPWRLEKMWSRTLFILFAGVLCSSTLNAPCKWYDPNNIPTLLESALMSSLTRPLFALGSVAVVVLLTVGDGLAIHHHLLKPRWVQPLARLCYGAYLIHNIHQTYDIGVTRHMRFLSFHDGFLNLLSDLIITFTMSLMMSLMIEGPFRRLEKRFITKQAPVKKLVQKVDREDTGMSKKIS